MFLYFGARAERDVYLEAHFRALAARHPNLRVVTVLSEPDGRPNGAAAGSPTRWRRIFAISTGSRPISPARR